MWTLTLKESKWTADSDKCAVRVKFVAEISNRVSFYLVFKASKLQLNFILACVHLCFVCLSLSY